MVVEYDESFSTQDLDNLTDRAVQDGGAASVLGSRKMVGNYSKLLEVLGVNIHKEAEVLKCQKGFKYGNSQKEITNSAASFRPMWEDNGGRSYATSSVAMRRSSWDGLLCGSSASLWTMTTTWFDTEVVNGKKLSEYIVRLAADLEELRNNEDEQILMPDDFTDHIDTIERLPLSAILDDEDIISRAETTVVTAPSEATPSNAEHIKQEDVKREIHPSAGPGESQSGPRLNPITEKSTGSTHDDGVSPERCTTNSITGAPTARLTTAKLRKMIYEARNLVKEHENLKAQAHEPARKEHVLWEVYAGRGRLRKSTSWKVAQPESSELNKAGTFQGQKTESPSSSC